MITGKVNSRGFDRKLATLRARNPMATQQGVAALGAGLAAQMIFLANQHRDTNRFVRSLEEAHNHLAREAGVPEIPMTTIRPSRRGDEIRERLELSLTRALKQEARLKGWIDANQKRDDFKPTWPSHRRLVRSYDKAGDITDRAIEALEKFDNASDEERASAIVIYGTKARRKTKSPVALTTRNLNRAVLTRFGGRGAVVGNGAAAMATVASLEPHARIVDRRYRIGSRSTANIRRLGVRTFNKNYLARLGKESGVNPAKLTGIDRSVA
jgi:hypothetical protein